MLLIDNNLSPRIARVLQDTYQGMVHVADIGLDEADDLVIWEYAKDENLDLLTKDGDFKDLQQLHGYPPKIVWIRSGNVSTSYIIDLLKKEETSIKQFLADKSVGTLEIH